MPDFLANLKLMPSPAGSIAPMTFVTPDGIQGNNLCRQATSTNDFPIAISQTGSDLAPNIVSATANVADSGQASGPGGSLQLFGAGDVCALRLGGTVTAGDFIMVDSAGRGITTTITGTGWIGAVALQSGVLNEIVEVVIYQTFASGGASVSVSRFLLGQGANVAVGTDVAASYEILQKECSPVRVDLAAKTGPVGSALIVDILISQDHGSTWTSLWAITPANRPSIADGSNNGSQTNFDTTDIEAGSWVRIDVIQVGSSIPGKGVTVSLLTQIG